MDYRAPNRLPSPRLKLADIEPGNRPGVTQAAVLCALERSRRVLVGQRRADLDAGEDLVCPVAGDIDAGLHEKLSQRAATAHLRDELLECRVVEFGFEFDR